MGAQVRSGRTPIISPKQSVKLMTTIRSFLAIPLPLELQKRLCCLQHELKKELPELRPAALKNLHLSLIFLGDQTEEMLAEIGTLMLLIGRSNPAFTLSLKGQRKSRV